MEAIKSLEESKCEARNSIAADLLAGLEVRLKSYVTFIYHGRLKQGLVDNYGTPDGRKRISELVKDYGMRISGYFEDNVGNKGQHKVYYMTPEDIQLHYQQQKQLSL